MSLITTVTRSTLYSNVEGPKKVYAEAHSPIRPDAFMAVHDGYDLVYASDKHNLGRSSVHNDKIRGRGSLQGMGGKIGTYRGGEFFRSQWL